MEIWPNEVCDTSICEWQAIDIALLIFNTLYSSPMNVDANWGPLLLMIFFGMPCIFHMSSQYILATSLKEIEVVVTISLIILENWSITTKIASLFSDLGRSPMMSMLISSYGVFGVDKRCKDTAFFMCYTLFC